jgi:hypothetical protein
MSEDVPPPASDPPVETLPNIGAAVARVLGEIGLTHRSHLEALGSVEVYRRVAAHLGRPPPRRFFLHGIEAALLGLPIRDLPPRRRVALARAALDLPGGGPAADVRPRRTIRSRGGRRRR